MKISVHNDDQLVADLQRTNNWIEFQQGSSDFKLYLVHGTVLPKHLLTDELAARGGVTRLRTAFVLFGAHATPNRYSVEAQRSLSDVANTSVVAFGKERREWAAWRTLLEWFVGKEADLLAGTEPLQTLLLREAEKNPRITEILGLPSHEQKVREVAALRLAALFGDGDAVDKLSLDSPLALKLRTDTEKNLGQLAVAAQTELENLVKAQH